MTSNDLSINIEKFCDTLGIRVCCVDFSEIEAKVGKKISGAVLKRGEKHTILVNKNNSDVNLRFAIAHELGHYFLHTKNNPGQIMVSFRGDISPRETGANQFAVELLMPKDLIQREYAKMVIPISDTLAQKFDVPNPAMRNRLESLGLIYL